MDMSAYGNVLIYVVIISAITIGLVVLAYTISRFLLRSSVRHPDLVEPFECGFDGSGAEPGVPFNIRFYLIALLFIIFDLEMAFVVPWSFVYKTIPVFGFWSMIIFLMLLLCGFIYEWKCGALEWE